MNYVIEQKHRFQLQACMDVMKRTCEAIDSILKDAAKLQPEHREAA